MHRRDVALTVLLSLLGCTSPTDLTLRLQPDLARQSEDQLCRALSRLVLSVDRDTRGEELEGLPAGEGSETVRYRDIDQDGAREAVFDYEWNGRSRLPVIDLTTHANRDQPLSLRVEGYDANGTLVALGGLAPVVARTQTEVAVPLNLLPSQLPLRVLATLPEAGQVAPLEDFSVTFSRRVRPETLTTESVYLDCSANGNPFRWPPTSLELLEDRYDPPQSSRHRLVAGLTSPYWFTRAACAIVVESGVQADDGAPIDQDATHAGPDGFRSQGFTVLSTDVSATAQYDCRQQADSEPFDCSALPGLLCNEETGLCQVGTACGDCADSTICGGVACVEDCRTLGVCSDPTKRCDSDGLCR